MKIEGKKCYLTTFSDSHLESPEYFSWLSDYEVMRYIGRSEYFKPFRMDIVRSYVESLWANPYCAFFAVHAKDDDAFIGTFKINFSDAEGLMTRSADVGIMIGDRSRWGKGFAIDILLCGCKHAFEKLNARKLTAGANASNPAVIKAFEKIGFKREACLRQKLLAENQYHDHILLGCFKDEFDQAIN